MSQCDVCLIGRFGGSFKSLSSVGAIPGDTVGPGQASTGHGDHDVDEQDDGDADADHGPEKHQKNSSSLLTSNSGFSSKIRQHRPQQDS